MFASKVTVHYRTGVKDTFKDMRVAVENGILTIYKEMNGEIVDGENLDELLVKSLNIEFDGQAKQWDTWSKKKD